MRSALGRRLARVEQAAARRPRIEDIVRSMTDQELIDAIAGCRRQIEAFLGPEPPEILACGRRAL